MRILLDACISVSTLRELQQAGYDVVRVESDLDDEAVLSWARGEARILVTADKDFGALVFLEGHTSSGILRLVDHPLSRMPALVLGALRSYAEELAAGFFVVVEPGQVRVRRPPAP